ncbi:aldehyde dehydrogenase family protein [Mesoterricola sediminis]|uniref:Aldehyde dehydrogenase n=1 Tax=Mesoterricola sediminis TaxID=2927980 RepID=A0AA48GST2_9BACT|nr:aldehyde dehydrogenase family protein [Mesoterricola sediminis]BDU75524.1 aldehyde dehydrogenase [Mesoterricola sediminis]
MPETPPQDLHARFEALRAHRWRQAATTADLRRRRLVALLDALMARRAEAHAALAADFGKAPAEVDLTELYPVLTEIRMAVKRLGRWMRPRSGGLFLSFLGSSAQVRPEPKGVVLILSPWNYPLLLALGPLVSAVAAGNCALLKPSEATPATNAFLRGLLAEVFPPGEVDLVEGGPETAQALLDLPFDHVFFTGSPRVGRIVMEAAARHLASVTLELGGKSPVFVDADADLETAAKRIVWGKFINAGQTCVAPDHVFVHASVHDALVEALARAVRTAYGATPEARRASPDFARIISRPHLDRLRALLAPPSGRVVLGGDWDEADRYFAPTLVADVPPDSPLMGEEIFGPILPVIPVPSMAAARERVITGPPPLALYVFTGTRAGAEAILAGTASGGACVGDTVLHFAHPGLPAGGVGASGFGKAHGHHGFLAFSNERAVLRQRTRFAPIQLMYPPYTRFVRRLVDLTLRWL